MRTYYFILIQLIMATPGFAKDILLSRGLVINSSVTVKRNTYRINGYDSLNQPVILIEGNNITVDFNHAELTGSNDKDWPNQFYGCAIWIKSGKNITIKNANIHGFKIGIWGTGIENLVIENCDLSYNYRQKLQSGRNHEDVSDWMSYHHNEHDEWQRYGAAIYLRNCATAIINNNEVTGGQCALMMTNCNNCLVSNNNFSFNSGIGIGMYRSSSNRIFNNNLDFDVRGYSHGIFNRGQDSAGILVFEQCNNNLFDKNSATHSGDGFFLWAGQHTMDTGEGGCNDNYIAENDFSYVPTNGVEVTFSRNRILNNIIRECDNGIWGGYSFNTIIYANQISGNRTGIAIEHGQNNRVEANRFENNNTAIKLWARNEQPKDWGYAQKRDTKSHGYSFFANTFEKNGQSFDISLTIGIQFAQNRFREEKNIYKINKTVSGIDSGRINFIPLQDSTLAIPHTGMKKKEEYPVGKKEIRITPWGPYDYRYPLIWLSSTDSSGKMYFDVLGPKGSWVADKYSGVKNLSATAGKFPATITAEKISGDISISLIYDGESFTTQFGDKIAKGKAYTFNYRQFEPQISWNVKWYSWDLAHDPNKNYRAFTKIFEGHPIKEEITSSLDYTWWGEIGPHLAADSFATVAVGRLKVPAGKYDLGVTADDLVKVYIDGRIIIDFWDVSKYVNDEDAHHSVYWQSDGKEHLVRVEHVENAGYATLIFSLRPE